jgi:hypothetical protein
MQLRAPLALLEETAMYRWIVRKRQRDTRRLAEHDQTVKAWLLIGAIFVGTILAILLPLLFSAMGHG